MKLNYKTFGQGQPIIILHGLFGMLDNWQTFGKKLMDEGYQVVLPDLRDHGRSPYSSIFNYEVMANDINDLIHDLELEPVILIGHSMGGKVAMKAAATYPDMIKKIVVVDMAPKKYTGGHEDIFKALKNMPLTEMESRTEITDWLTSKLHNNATVQFLLKNISREKEGHYSLKLNLPLLDDSYPTIMDALHFQESVALPALFVRGGRSKYILDEDWSEIQDNFPNSELATIEEAGHWIHAEKPDELFDLVLSFIKQS